MAHAQIMKARDRLVETPLEAVDEKGNKLGGRLTTKWFYSKKELELYSPSRLIGISYDEELRLLQQGCAFIRNMSDRINQISQRDGVTALSIAVALTQLRRFFLVHDLKSYDVRDIATAALFLSCKSEECPRKLELFVLVSYRLRVEMELPSDQWEKSSIINEEAYKVFCEYVLYNEGLILKTIGLELNVDVPHPMIIKLCNTYLANNYRTHKIMYFLTTDALHLTNWACRYRPMVFACIIFYITCIWAQIPLPPPNEKGVLWYSCCSGESFPVDEGFFHEHAWEYAKLLKSAADSNLLMSRNRVEQLARETK